MTTITDANSTQLSDSYVKRGKSVLLLVQLFSTFPFSIYYSSLVLYVTKHLGFSQASGTALMGSFFAFNYGLHVVGGMIGGRLMSYRNLYVLGAIIQTLGGLLMVYYQNVWFYVGLGGFIASSGAIVTCINCLLTQLFHPEDKRREGAFLWNYSMMNVGFLIGFFCTGLVEKQIETNMTGTYATIHHWLFGNYQHVFMVAGVGNVLGLLAVFINWGVLKDLQTSYHSLSKQHKLLRSIMGCVLHLGICVALAFLLQSASISNHLVLFFGICILCFVGYLAAKQPTSQSREKMSALLLLALAAIIFFILYSLMPMGLTLFYEHNVHQFFMGMNIPPQWVTNINSIMIIIGGPLMAVMYQRLRARGVNISIPKQFVAALILVGLGMFSVCVGIHFADKQGYSAIGWTFGFYFCESIAELLISPIGFALIGQLAPARLQNFLMGMWLMNTGVAGVLADIFSEMALGKSDATNPLITNAGYLHTFTLLGALAIGGGLVLSLLVPYLHRLMRENEGVAASF